MTDQDGWREPCTGDDVRDVHGPSYRIGPDDRELLGLSRAWVAAAAWLAMLATGGVQYGFGVFAVRHAQTAGWGRGAMPWGFAAWAVCHAVASGALPWLRRRYRVTPGEALNAGAVGCALGLLALGKAGSPLLGLAGYGVACGLGTGLAYGACLATTAAWYPDRPARTAVVGGAYAYGVIPFILTTASVGDLTLPLEVLAFAIVVAVAACAPFLQEPPPHWWPPHLDPQPWEGDRSLKPDLHRDRLAIREHATREVLRRPVTWAMTVLAACVWAVALFDIAYLPSFGLASGWRMWDGALAPAAFAAGSGGFQVLAVRRAHRVGPSRVVAAAMCAGAAAQVVLAGAGAHRALGLFLLAAFGSGAATGAWFALLPGLVRSCFGDQPGLRTLWRLYATQAVGGVLGAGCAGWLVEAVGYPPVLIASGVLCLTAAALAPLLRMPGLHVREAAGPR